MEKDASAARSEGSLTVILSWVSSPESDMDFFLVLALLSTF